MPAQRAVVITGTSSGIGEACALHLDRLGFRVFAGVRKHTDGEALRRKASPMLQPVRLDITSSEEIRAAADVVRQAIFRVEDEGNRSHAGAAGRARTVCGR